MKRILRVLGRVGLMLIGAVGGMVALDAALVMLGLAPVPGSRPYPPPSPEVTVESKTELGVEQNLAPDIERSEALPASAISEPSERHPSLIDDIVSGRYKPYAPWMTTQAQAVATPEPPCSGHWIWMPPDPFSPLRTCCPVCSVEEAKTISDDLHAAYEQRVNEAAARAKKAAEERRKSGRVDCVSQINGRTVYTNCW